MGKRLISTDGRTETIIKKLPEGSNISSFMCNAALDEVLPVYSHLRVEALYLLDVITDGAKEWTGNKLIVNGSSDPRDSLAFYTKQTFERGIEWLKRGHHIRNCAVLNDGIAFYVSGDSSEVLSKQNDYVNGRIDEIIKVIKEIDPSYSGFHVSLGNFARDVLSHWNDLWDNDLAYDILAICAQNEDWAVPIPPMKCISLLQKMETQFITEAIGEN